MSSDSNTRAIRIMYFSGTGGAKRIADTFMQESANRGLEAYITALDYSNPQNSILQSLDTLESVDLVFLIFAVHAFDAPIPVYDWIKHINNQYGKRIAVISVSGGGEVWPNTGCRNNCCKALEEKGFTVVYEKMMCMPSNWVSAVNDHLAMRLINAVPEKVNKILDSVLIGKIRRTKFRKGIIQSFITKIEKNGAKRFARELMISSKCTGCGWCAKNCPVNNIELQNCRPVFKNQCVMCFRCIYNCPFHAMQSKSFMVLKTGYSLTEVEKRMKGVELESIQKCCRGILWKSVGDYLADKDGY